MRETVVVWREVIDREGQHWRYSPTTGEYQFAPKGGTHWEQGRAFPGYLGDILGNPETREDGRLDGDLRVETVLALGTQEYRGPHNCTSFWKKKPADGKVDWNHAASPVSTSPDGSGNIGLVGLDIPNEVYGAFEPFRNREPLPIDMCR